MEYANAAQGQIIGKDSRIVSDVSRLLSMVKRVHEARERTQRHSSSLGYYPDGPPIDAAAGKVQPISNTLSNALSDLENALDKLDGALNVFD